MNFSIINKILASFIVLACFTLAYNLAFTDFMDTKIIGVKRIFFIILLLAYAGFRIYRIAKTRND
jgi:hypothetical protein